MNLKEVFSSHYLVLIDFYSKTCPPCQILEGELVKSKEILKEGIEIFQVDQQKQKKIFKTFKVNSVPHLKLFKAGKPVWEHTGLIAANELVNELNKWK